MRSASRVGRERARRAPGRAWRRRTSRAAAQLGELAVEQRRALLVERAERLVEDEQLGLVQQRPAEREPLEHPAREGVGALGCAPPRGRSARAASRSARAARARGRAGRRGRGSRARSARGRRAARGRGSRPARAARRPRARRAVGDEQAGDEPQQRRLAGAVRAGDEQEAAARRGRGRRRRARASRRTLGRGRGRGSSPQPASRTRPSDARASRRSASASTNSEERDADHAVHREERRVEPAQVARPDERVLVGEQRGDGSDAEPVERRRPAGRGPAATSKPTVATCSAARPAEDAALAPARRPRVQPLARGRPRRRRASRRGRSRRPRPRRRRRAPTPARAGRRGSRPRRRPARARRRRRARGGEPRDALQVRVDDEADDRDRPEPAARAGRAARPRRGRARARRGRRATTCARESCPRGQLAPRGARVARVDLRVDQPVERHRQRPGADHRQRDPEQVVRARDAVDREERADVGERQREDRVLDLDERREAARELRTRSLTSAGAPLGLAGEQLERVARAPAAAPRSRRGSRPASRAG